jgi:predicted dehydrogenase
MRKKERMLGVGIIGLGPVTQAIHLPTLAALADEFRVVCVMDLDEATARAIAEPIDARWTTSIEELLTDDAVDVVAVCSPHSHHVAHTVAALQAGKAVLCEKPLALDGAGLNAVRLACRGASSPLLVGWMHVFDPVVSTTIEAWRTGGHRASSIRVSAVLPSNSRFENAAAEILPRLIAPGGPADHPMREALLSLAVHDLPLIRRLLPEFPGPIEVSHASWRAPWGYLVLARIGDARVELHASLGQPWKPSWTLEAISETAGLTLEFPPSYVHAGSAISRITRPGARVEERTETAGDGYDVEWRRISRAVREGEAGDVDESLLDSEFAIDFADAVDQWIESGSP